MLNIRIKKRFTLFWMVNILEGSLPINKEKLVLAWIEIHKEELMADWALASEGQQIFKIEPLK